MSFSACPALAEAQLLAAIAFADAAAGPCEIVLYTTTQPAPGAPEGVPPQAVITLAKPCGSVTAGALTLTPADPTGALVLKTGVPRWARWRRSDGVALADGSVTNPAGGGDFTVADGVTAPGDDSPNLIAGGLVRLGAVVML